MFIESGFFGIIVILVGWFIYANLKYRPEKDIYSDHYGKKY